jgi:2-oxoisovalerate dehydrogenase E1 component
MPKKKGTVALPLEKEEIIKDYRLAYQSRQASIIGRREVLSGKAKFGIFGDGKELANIAIARAFQKGDWRSGYYRDQTWMFMLGVMSIQEFFAQLYAHADLNHESNTGGRSMNAHFASRYINPDGSWKNQTESYNTSADVSPTGTQMPRTVGWRMRRSYIADSRNSKGSPILEERKRGHVCQHRQRLHGGGHVLGVGQCHRRAAGAGGHHRL